MINRYLIVLSGVFLLGCSTSGAFISEVEQGPQTYTFSMSWNDQGLPRLPLSYENVRNLLESEHPMLALYREDLTHEAVVNFFVELTGNPEVAMPTTVSTPAMR